MNNKGNIGIIIVAGLLGIIILVMFITNVATRECSASKDCEGNQYCGSDFQCHNFPDKIVVKQSDYVPAAIIIAGGLVGAAVIYRWKAE